MWDSKQYSWMDIVEYIGRNPDKIVGKVRGEGVLVATVQETLRLGN